MSGKDIKPERRWYVIHTYSGYENKVRESLQKRIETMGLQDFIFQVLIPTEDVVEVKRGKKQVSTRKFYPGYLLVEMIMTDETWLAVKNTPKVTNFVGSGARPAPLSPAEVDTILRQVEAGADKPKPKVQFQKGDRVKITDGPFASFSGVIDEVNPDKNTLRVMVTIFGRATPVELDFLQVESL